jgi:hypothetical protein
LLHFLCAHGHCCLVPTRVVCKFWKKFGQMRKNSAFFQKYVFTAIHDNIRKKCLALKYYLKKSSADNCLQKPKTKGKFIFLNFSYNIFCRPVFGRFCLKSAAVRPPNLHGQSFFYSAGFVLFCRIFGRLAAVHTADRSLIIRFGRPAGEKRVYLILRKNRPVQQTWKSNKIDQAVQFKFA